MDNLYLLFGSSFLAATIVPFSSEVHLGLAISSGASAPFAIVIATLGNTLGGLTSYGLGRLGKWQWIQRWFRVSEEDVQRRLPVIRKYSAPAALLCWTPIFGDVIAIGLGYLRCHVVATTIFMAVGKLGRYIVISWLV